MTGPVAVLQQSIALFEACCKEKIQQFEDAGSDEEDIWDEKDVTFAPEAQRRPRYAHLHTHAHKDARTDTCQVYVINAAGPESCLMCHQVSGCP